MAYFSEIRKADLGANMDIFFILAWTGCQGLRNGALNLLRDGSEGASPMTLMAVFAFLDKYTGPLGVASLDTALLMLICGQKEDQSSLDKDDSKCDANKDSSKAQPFFTVPGQLLWSFRMMVSRLERPICQLILLHTSAIPVQAVAMAFALITCIGVLSIYWDQRKGVQEPQRPKVE
eukprot:TRINITY_DN119049_c0_g1_i1.p1 TRINITY_DN119049_c0_g1~~TRINITY_DN119049_c0_g1_i1.p1  ORF type:complete len:200 (-),score=32.23 TRINITY_DN119049_c0_g1_i1:69-599(-)